MYPIQQLQPWPYHHRIDPGHRWHPRLKFLKPEPEQIDKPSCQQGGWNEEDWNNWNWNESWDSDWSQDWTWNSWNSEKKWHQNEPEPEFEYVKVEEEYSTDSNSYPENQEAIKMTHKILQQRLGPGDDMPIPILRSGKRGRSQGHSHTPPKKIRRRGGRNRNRALKARSASSHSVEVGQLRYSQLTCGSYFSCGRPVSQLVQQLLEGSVKMSAPFLRLTVFEDADEHTGEYILRCIDNRRLFAVKEYARRSRKDVMVNVEFFSQNTVKQVKRFMRNTDATDGIDVQVRI